ncbi:hypothetical protein C8Q74DRAFT_222013 [Fomes fomentarius]|nr:hypothetical protein C8Q74DRAFT_222013 [Fomes fomentarius]
MYGGYIPSPLVNTGVPSGMRLNVPVPEDCPSFAPSTSQSTPTYPSIPSTGMSFNSPAIQSLASNTASDLALSQSVPHRDYAPTTTSQFASTSHQETASLLEPHVNVPTPSTYPSGFSSYHENVDERMELTSTGLDPVPPCADVDLSPGALLRDSLQSPSQISSMQTELDMPTPGDVQVQESLEPDHVWPSELDQWFCFDESA